MAGQIQHGGRLLGGEAFFVPKQQQGGQAGAAAEDSGYLMTFVTDEATLRSELVVYDAASMSSRPVARLAVPQRVPHGFHCSWVAEEQLAAQGTAP